MVLLKYFHPAESNWPRRSSTRFFSFSSFDAAALHKSYVLFIYASSFPLECFIFRQRVSRVFVGVKLVMRDGENENMARFKLAARLIRFGNGGDKRQERKKARDALVSYYFLIRANLGWKVLRGRRFSSGWYSHISCSTSSATLSGKLNFVYYLRARSRRVNEICACKSTWILSRSNFFHQHCAEHKNYFLLPSSLLGFCSSTWRTIWKLISNF